MARRLFWTSASSAALAAVCCFTPLLLWLLPALGFAAWLAWADLVLLPVLVLSLIAMGLALWKKRAARPS